ncbi:MAG: hypothetical protein ABI203_06335, partial [Mucilaginibacter sp.]
MKIRHNNYRSFVCFSIVLMELLLILGSCNQPHSKGKIRHVKIRPVINIIVDSIAQYNQLNSSGVGYAGIRTVQWDRYEKLSKTATLPELRELTNHKNSVVRCYAFDALTDRKDTAAFNILLGHLQDTAMVSTFIGCMISKERTGDYFLNIVKPYDSTDTGYKLSFRQKAIVDSILLFDKHIMLYAKYNLLYDLKPQAQYYNRVKEIATNGKMPVSVWTLAKYKRLEDIGIITKAFYGIESEDYAIRSVTLLPDSSFYPILIKIFEREWKEKLYDYGKW